MSLLSEVSDQSLRSARVRGLIVVSATLLGACGLRLFYLQMVRGRALAEASENNRTQVLVEHAPRGRILDRNGTVLADDEPVFVALFSSQGLSPADFQTVLNRLAPILNIPRSELEHRLLAALRARFMMRISDRLTRDQAFRVMQDRVHLPGISLTTEEQRIYPFGPLASHVLGYVGPITDDELEQHSEEGYHPGDWIGKSGLELFYDAALHGQDGGFVIEVDARGRQIRVIRHLLSQAGKDIVLSLDQKLEALAERRLRQTHHPGAAVVINPQTGELLALASSPGFDPNVFLPMGDSEERRQLLSDPDLPLYNRAIQGLYPPGSIFKMVTTLAALDTHRLKPEERVNCTGSYVIGREKRVFHCWKTTGHGWVDLHQAIAKSCDVYFYRVGLSVGPELLERFAKAFGLGQPTGVDLPSEKRGSLPFTVHAIRRQHWLAGETLNYAIGQGALQVTPLQMANLVSGVANHGTLWQPFLMKASARFGDDARDSVSPRMLTKIPLTDSSWGILQDDLVEVVRSGTGTGARIPGVAVAGKTGTAQVSRGKEHSWFVSYAPVEHPEVACAVLVEHGGHGGVTAAPIVHDLMAQAMGLDVPPAAAAEDVQSD